MRTLVVAVIAAVAGFIIGTLGYQNTATNTAETQETQTLYETVIRTATETIDLERLRDVSAASPHQDDNNYECTVALQRITGDPLAGIILYVDRWWQGDACAAYEHQVTHGWH